MTNFHVTVVDEHDCNSIADEFLMTAVDKADAELQLLDEFGPIHSAYMELHEIVHFDEL